jgi:hypothetical protein
MPDEMDKAIATVESLTLGELRYSLSKQVTGERAEEIVQAFDRTLDGMRPISNPEAIAGAVMFLIHQLSGLLLDKEARITIVTLNPQSENLLQ